MLPFIRKLDPTPDTVLVAIHGAGLFSAQDYENLLRAIDAQIPDGSTQYDCFGVLYDDLMPLQVSGIDQARADFKKKFKQQVVREQFLGLSAMARYRGTTRMGANDTTISTKSVGSDFMDLIFKNGIDKLVVNLISMFVPVPPIADQLADEVYLYLADPKFATKIQNCLLSALDQAKPYKQILLISHSLGTVVALDAINKWQSDKKIDCWLTLGCPLNKVRLLRDTGTPNALVCDYVSHWYNLYDNNDIIAGVLGPNFSPQPNDPPDKPSVHDIFVEVGRGMPEAHDYLRNPMTLKFIADALQQRSVP